MNKFESTYNEVIFIGISFLFFSFGCYILNYYNNVLVFLSLGVLMIFLGYIKFKFDDDVALVFGLILIPMVLVGSAYFNWTYVKERNQKAPIKIQCGVIENVKDHPQNKDKRFEVVNQQERILFPLYPRDVEIVISGVSKNFCVRYSWDKRWSNKPEVYKIYPQSFE